MGERGADQQRQVRGSPRLTNARCSTGRIGQPNTTPGRRRAVTCSGRQWTFKNCPPRGDPRVGGQGHRPHCSSHTRSTPARPPRCPTRTRTILIWTRAIRRVRVDPLRDRRSRQQPDKQVAMLLAAHSRRDRDRDRDRERGRSRPACSSFAQASRRARPMAGVTADRLRFDLRRPGRCSTWELPELCGCGGRS